MNNEQRYVWRWRRTLPERTGQTCRVLVVGHNRHALIEFDDGFRVRSSLFALRKVK